MLEPELEYLASAVVLPLTDLELAEVDEVGLIEGFGTQLGDDALVYAPGGILVAALELGLGHLEVRQ